MFHTLNIWALFIWKLHLCNMFFHSDILSVCVVFKDNNTADGEQMQKQVFGNVAHSTAPSLTRGGGVGGVRGSEVALSSAESSCWVWYAGTAELRPEERSCAAPPAAAMLRLLRAFIKPGGRLPEPLSSPPHAAVQIYHLLLVATCASEAFAALISTS